MGCYIDLNDASTIEDIIADIRRRPQGAKMLVAGNFNSELYKPEGTGRTEDIAVTLADSGLKDMSTHLFPRFKSWSRDGNTWSMRHRDRVVQYRTNYLREMDCRIYQNVPVRDVTHN